MLWAMPRRSGGTESGSKPTPSSLTVIRKPSTVERTLTVRRTRRAEPDVPGRPAAERTELRRASPAAPSIAVTATAGTVRSTTVPLPARSGSSTRT
jgi:hypothetical protein